MMFVMAMNEKMTTMSNDHGGDGDDSNDDDDDNDDDPISAFRHPTPTTGSYGFRNLLAQFRVAHTS